MRAKEDPRGCAAKAYSLIVTTRAASAADLDEAADLIDHFHYVELSCPSVQAASSLEDVATHLDEVNSGLDAIIKAMAERASL